MKLMKCKICGNEVILISKEQIGTIECCKNELKEVTYYNAVDGDAHKIYFTTRNNTLYLEIGRPLHPMTSEHKIEYIIITTNKGYIYRCNPDSAKLEIKLSDDEIVDEIIFKCNVHGFWKYSIKMNKPNMCSK